MHHHLELLLNIWDGTSWTEVNDLNEARLELWMEAGSYTDAINFGGYPTGDQDS